MAAADLQHCVELLASILETDGLVKSIQPKKKPRPTTMKTKMKGAHVFSKPKVGSKGSRLTSSKKQTSAKLAKKAGAVSNSTQKATDDDEDLAAAPYNMRLASSTPNSTLLQMHKAEPLCPHRAKKLPQHPIVLDNRSYSLTSEQSNPLNASSQVNLMHPLDAKDGELRLTKGRIEFQPNPATGLNQNSNRPEILVTLPDPVLAARSHISGGGDYNFSNHYAEPTSYLHDVTALSSYTDVNIPEKENDADGYSLYSDRQPNFEKSAGSVLTTGVKPSEHKESKLTSTTANIHPGFGDARPLTNMFNVNNPRFREAVLSLKTALRQEAQKSETSTKAVKPPTSSKVSAAKSRNRKGKGPRSNNKPCAQPKGSDDALRTSIEQASTETTEKCVQFALQDTSTQVSSLSGDSKSQPPEPTCGLEVTNTLPECALSPQYLRHMQTLQGLLGDLKSLSAKERDVDLQSLATQIEQAAAMFIPGLGGVNWQTELELAIQPLRSENAQLRRKVRILNQQLKDKSTSQEPTENSSLSYHVVELEIENKSLNQKVKDAKVTEDSLRTHLELLQSQLETLNREKTHFMDILNNKDTEKKSLETYLRDDMAKLQEENQRLRMESQGAVLQKEASSGQVSILRISLEKRDEEISQLRNLVRSLQASMTRLLGNLKALTPDTTHKTSVSRTSPRSNHGNGLPEEEPATQRPGCVPQEAQHNVDTWTLAENDATVPKTAVRNPSPTRRALFPTSKKTSHAKKESPKGAAPHITSSPKRNSRADLKPSDTNTVDNMDLTDYIMFPGASPLKVKASAAWKSQSADDRSLSDGVRTPQNSEGPSPTVKELLTPLANRLQDQYKRLSLAGGKQGTAQTQRTSGPPRELTDSDLDVVPLEDTLVESLPENEDLEINGGAQKTSNVDAQASSKDSELSRYSMTDYFKKYSATSRDALLGNELSESNKIIEENVQRPGERNVAGEQSSVSDELSQHTDQFRDHDVPYISSNLPAGGGHPSDIVELRGEDMPTAIAEYQTDEQAAMDNVSGPPAHISLQESLYRGTELDTSLSTIDDLFSLASLSMTADSLVSAATLDDSAFRQGLADLDANIAKIQQQLKANLG